jgi:hypothetical protein
MWTWVKQMSFRKVLVLNVGAWSLALLFVVGTVSWLPVYDLFSTITHKKPMGAAAWGAKKKSKAELEKMLADAQKDLEGLEKKTHARQFFSPDDHTLLMSLPPRVRELVANVKDNPLLPDLVLRLGQLLTRREEPIDAWECFQLFVASYPEHPQKNRAVYEQKKLEAQQKDPLIDAALKQPVK